jgi:hypothetical protein
LHYAQHERNHATAQPPFVLSVGAHAPESKDERLATPFVLSVGAHAPESKDERLTTPFVLS